MPIRKDTRIFTATFRNLKLKAFGVDNVIRESFAITVFQESCRPARWAARPKLSRGAHQWVGSTAAAVQELVAADFEECVSPWAEMPASRPASPSLRSGTDVPAPAKQA